MLTQAPGVDRKQRSGSTPPLTFKVATETWEFERIHRLNYETFVEEIPQHAPNLDRVLIDRFHDKNTYVVCIRGEQLIGMVAVRGDRPFSLDHKLEDVDSYLPAGRPICEIRLLAVDRAYRNGRIMQGLLTRLAGLCRSRGYRLAIVSGTVREERLYSRLGFVPFGPLVGTDSAMYQPMYRPLETVEEELGDRFRGRSSPAPLDASVNLLPGPVSINPDVRKAFGRPPVSHRSSAFVETIGGVKSRLCDLIGCNKVEILLGSGTLANDVVAGQLSLENGRGLVLSNGEFGERLLDHASRMRLDFDTLRVDWGDVFARGAIERALDDRPATAWLWAVHCETSSGVLNDIAMLQEVCARRDIRLCTDCISSVGTVPMDLGGVYLASGVSGKGIGAFPGLSMVFYNHDVLPAPTALPRYLDLGLHAASRGVPFTGSSNLLFALEAALKRYRSTDVYRDTVEVSSWLTAALKQLDLKVVAPEEHASPAVITVSLPVEVNSAALGKSLDGAGYLLSYNSDYLLSRNWIQVCLMGNFSRDRIAPLLGILRNVSPEGVRVS